MSEGNVATVTPNGPLVLAGDVHVLGADPATKTALCRCGNSQNKPYCDGSHKAGFEDPGAVQATGDSAVESGGPLEVQPMPDGPLRVSGNLTIRSGDGATEWNGTKTALCRCGHSQNKPFCDGTHKTIGFTAP